MISRTRWLLRQLTRQLWFRATIFAAVGFVAAMAGVIAERYMGWEPPTRIATDTVERILDILASSMLAVTTFSLNVMVTAYGSATSNVTPRATKLLRQDSTTQNALGAFIGAFLFSLVGIIALGTGLYGDRGRLVLFAVTLAVVAFVITAMLRWIDHLSGLGRVGETARIVEETTRAALLDRAAAPTLGARACDPAYMTSSDHEPVTTRRIGYVQHVDLERLSAIAEDAGCAIHIEKPPGSFVFANDALARVHMDRGPAPDAETLGRMASAFLIERSLILDHESARGRCRPPSTTPARRSMSSDARRVCCSNMRIRALKMTTCASRASGWRRSSPAISSATPSARSRATARRSSKCSSACRKRSARWRDRATAKCAPPHCAKRASRSIMPKSRLRSTATNRNCATSTRR